MTDTEIRSILAPLAEGNLLLPNSAVAEILNFTSPKPLKQTPSWLLGELPWRGWQVPIICYEQLIKVATSHRITPKSRILIVKTLGESTQVNYIGLLIQGLPRLKKITSSTLLEIETEKLPKMLFSKVRVEDLDGFIPALSALTLTVEEAAYSS